ncbi:HELZ2-like protein [Mya arenaria]|uniref:HELZ2-like protein n=1 Tax=Mya arenaria TaxID=6604 RepID=A0ABY7DCZ9_MYAAR|nr:HELZ2-like protein [Mya arenaria]
MFILDDVKFPFKIECRSNVLMSTREQFYHLQLPQNAIHIQIEGLDYENIANFAKYIACRLFPDTHKARNFVSRILNADQVLQVKSFARNPLLFKFFMYLCYCEKKSSFIGITKDNFAIKNICLNHTQSAMILSLPIHLYSESLQAESIICETDSECGCQKRLTEHCLDHAGVKMTIPTNCSVSGLHLKETQNVLRHTKELPFVEQMNFVHISWMSDIVHLLGSPTPLLRLLKLEDMRLQHSIICHLLCDIPSLKEVFLVRVDSRKDDDCKCSNPAALGKEMHIEMLQMDSCSQILVHIEKALNVKTILLKNVYARSDVVRIFGNPKCSSIEHLSLDNIRLTHTEIAQLLCDNETITTVSLKNLKTQHDFGCKNNDLEPHKKYSMKTVLYLEVQSSKGFMNLIHHASMLKKLHLEKWDSVKKILQLTIDCKLLNDLYVDVDQISHTEATTLFCGIPSLQQINISTKSCVVDSVCGCRQKPVRKQHRKQFTSLCVRDVSINMVACLYHIKDFSLLEQLTTDVDSLSRRDKSILFKSLRQSHTLRYLTFNGTQMDGNTLVEILYALPISQQTLTVELLSCKLTGASSLEVVVEAGPPNFKLKTFSVWHQRNQFVLDNVFSLLSGCQSSTQSVLDNVFSLVSACQSLAQSVLDNVFSLVSGCQSLAQSVLDNVFSLVSGCQSLAQSVLDNVFSLLSGCQSLAQSVLDNVFSLVSGCQSLAQSVLDNVFSLVSGCQSSTQSVLDNVFSLLSGFSFPYPSNVSEDVYFSRKADPFHKLHLKHVHCLLSDNKKRNVVMIRIPKEYDFVIQMTNESQRREFIQSLKQAVTDHEDVVDCHEAKEKHIYMQAFTQKKRNPLLERMVMYGLKNLENASQLATDVALRQTPSVAAQYADVDQLMQSSRQILHVPNQQQEEALKHALAQPLCVIQGCVGSGKSMMAAKLGYMFAQRNQALQARGRLQVLVCAPTEAGVDLVNDYNLLLFISFLSTFKHKHIKYSSYLNTLEKVSLLFTFAKLLHVSEQQLSACCAGLQPRCGEGPPSPPRVVSRSTSTFADQEISQIKNHYSSLSLYELIRGSNSPYCKRLKEYEGLFSLYPDDIADDQFEDYIQLVSRAESAVLAEAEIILCTCITSAQLKISSVTHVQQIIVDDTNTGTEPEVLVPLSIYGDVKQVTLIGDINQAGPTVVNDVARQLGLGRSIMRSYLSTAVYLNIQYRVHEGIVDFPSRFCYDNRLLCGSIAQRQPSVLNWPGGRNKPVAFCQLDGQEQNLPLNVVGAPEEQKCVQVAVSLVRTYNVAMTSVGIVCPSRAQCKVVEDKLAVTGCNIPCFTLHEIQEIIRGKKK